MISWSDHRAAKQIANPLERDAQLKRMMGFGDASFTKAADVLRGANTGDRVPPAR
jgi:uncharacterized protein